MFNNSRFFQIISSKYIIVLWFLLNIVIAIWRVLIDFFKGIDPFFIIVVTFREQFTNAIISSLFIFVFWYVTFKRSDDFLDKLPDKESKELKTKIFNLWNKPLFPVLFFLIAGSITVLASLAFDELIQFLFGAGSLAQSPLFSNDANLPNVDDYKTDPFVLLFLIIFIPIKLFFPFFYGGLTIFYKGIFLYIAVHHIVGASSNNGSKSEKKGLLEETFFSSNELTMEAFWASITIICALIFLNGTIVFRFITRDPSLTPTGLLIALLIMAIIHLLVLILTLFVFIYPGIYFRLKLVSLKLERLKKINKIYFKELKDFDDDLDKTLTNPELEKVALLRQEHDHTLNHPIWPELWLGIFTITVSIAGSFLSLVISVFVNKIFGG